MTATQVTPEARRYPVDTLMTAARIEDDDVVASLVGVHRTLIGRWRRKHRHLDVWEADRWAVACDLLPSEVWEEWEHDPVFVDEVEQERQAS